MMSLTFRELPIGYPVLACMAIVGLSSGCGPSGAGRPPSSVTGSSPVVSPAPPPPPVPHGAHEAVPIGAANAPPTAAESTPLRIVNQHPDLVVFGYDWLPKGPRTADMQFTDMASAAENEALVDEVLRSLRFAATDDSASQEQALQKLKETHRIDARRAEVSSALEPLLDSLAQRVQILATAMCATWGSPPNLPSLARLASADDPHVSNYAAHAIYCIVGSDDMSQVAKYLAVENAKWGAVRAFLAAKTGEEHVWPLLRSEDPKTIINACSALNYVGTAQSVGDLTSLLKHPDEKVRQMARATMGMIQRRGNR